MSDPLDRIAIAIEGIAADLSEIRKILAKRVPPDIHDFREARDKYLREPTEKQRADTSLAEVAHALQDLAGKDGMPKKMDKANAFMTAARIIRMVTDWKSTTGEKSMVHYVAEALVLADGQDASLWRAAEPMVQFLANRALIG